MTTGAVVKPIIGPPLHAQRLARLESIQGAMSEKNEPKRLAGYVRPARQA